MRDLISNENLINYINYVKSLDPIERQIYLGSNNWMINDILRDYYGYKDVILEDKELLNLIESHRVGDIPRSGLISGPDMYEVSYLMKAWKSQQYHRFMCHKLSRYMNLNFKPYPVSNDEDYECCICWRGIHGMDRINREGLNNNDLAFTSLNTGTCMCLGCMYQLLMFSQLMNLINDKDFIKIVNTKFN